MISLSSVAKDFGARTLFEGVTLRFDPGQRYGVVGANGSGKSTLLRMLSGQEGPSRGEVSRPRQLRLGVLEQDHFRYEAERILHVAMMGNAELWSAMVEKERILARAGEHFDGERYAELEDLVQQRGGYALEARAGEILEGLGIPTEVHGEPLSVLSGGFRLRVLLAKVLAAEPDLLLLDEPTNHLDIVSIRWLEKFLVGFAGTALIVSHDHRFLDNVATAIVDIDYQTVKVYTGNYAAFTAAKRSERERREKEIEKRQGEIARHQAFVDRFRAKNTKARQAQSKLKTIERIQIEPLPESSRRYPVFQLRQRRPSGRQVLALEGIHKRYGDKRVLEDVSLTVRRGERVAIIGANGIGKSTLLKIAVGEVDADAGSVEWGYEAHPGYVAQDHAEQLGDPQLTVEAWLARACPGESVGFVRNRLGAMLFSGDDVSKKLQALSGGEGARLAFARQIVMRPNVMLLDEPTNHLDLEAIEALVAGLRAYDGTLVFVSHDRWFVSELATRVIELTREGLNDFAGSYAEYIERCGDDHLDAETVLRRARAPKRRKRAGRTPAADPRRERRKLEERLEAVTGEIEATEQALEELNQRFCDPDFFERTPPEEIAGLQARHRDGSARLETLLRDWERIGKQLEALPEA